MALNMDVVGQELEPTVYNYTWKDVALYNIGIGATELDFTYEPKLKVLPTFAVVGPFDAMAKGVMAIGANLMMVLHGEQRIEMLKHDIPVEARTITTGKITQIWDKGSGAVCILETLTRTEEGEELFKNMFSLFVRGEGGFGGEKGPPPGNVPPEREPDAIVEDRTYPIQNLIYRLSGDVNPLHIDPDFARLGGFDRPILHGLCTYGYVCRAVLKTFMDNEPSNLKTFEARFRNVVFPGQKIITRMWNKGNKIVLSAETEDGRNVISNAAAEMRS
ncbi:MAG: MaoC/PaaZ C-terminal domain-containing protein [Desulfobacterales bacterium]